MDYKVQQQQQPALPLHGNLHQQHAWPICPASAPALACPARFWLHQSATRAPPDSAQISPGGRAGHSVLPVNLPQSLVHRLAPRANIACHVIHVTASKVHQLISTHASTHPTPETLLIILTPHQQAPAAPPIVRGRFSGSIITCSRFHKH
jgi:hypothetical protein